MTTYSAIEHLINSKAVGYETAKAVVYDAYYNGRIDGIEYNKLIHLAERKLT